MFGGSSKSDPGAPRESASPAAVRRRLAIRLAAWGLVIAGASVPLGSILRQRAMAESLLARESRLAVEAIDVINERRLVHNEEEIPDRSTISDFFAGSGFDAKTSEEILRAARPVYDLSRVRAGNRVDIIRSGFGDLRALTYEVDRDRLLWITKQQDGFHSELRAIPYEIVVTGVAGTVRDSLFQAMEDLGEGVWLTVEIAEIFGWDVDFSTDTRVGDTFEIVVEKKILHGERWGYGRILAAQYTNAGELHQAVLFRDPSGRPAYYAPSGKSLQKAFLRSPLKFAAPVTSRFSNSRFHPILKRYRAHHGVDYGVPVGSAVQAVGEGRVAFAGPKGQGGNTVQLRHPKGFDTYYLHLSRILVKPGQQVRQGEIIAKSGMTGLATGPHLDFRVSRHGRFLNFLTLKLPPAESVAPKDKAGFAALRTQLVDQLARLHDQTAGKVEHANTQPLPGPPTNPAAGR
ncbi:MAG: peptidoglycan DD-metalloendopeptidase family protein [Acidobacteria bacterium]|nr:peptidoglycan DD-metalloendopeptidase family protein [Acidobacteriota bacterium]